MALTFYCGSGSPFAWKVWLALEHKGVPYELKVLSFQDGDLKKPDYLAINPRGKVPALVDDDLRLFESSAIVEYLDDKYPAKPVIGRDPGTRAIARRIAAEVDSYLYPTARKLLAQTLFRAAGTGDPIEIATAKEELTKELARFESYSSGGFFLGGSPTLADYAVYPMIALARRIELKQPGNGITIPAKLQSFAKTVEGLPYLGKTIPPHWKA